MKMPDRKSLTRVWEPKPSATPMMPALARTGPMSRPSSLSAIVTTIAAITPEVMLLSRLPMVLARCTRRVEPGGGWAALRPKVTWREPVGEDALLGAAHEAVDQPVQTNWATRPMITSMASATAFAANSWPRLDQSVLVIPMKSADMGSSILIA